ncbi:MAG: site-2 protease family protein [Clostridia bacterium]|nr:site-2 protease family protein [Clostridia bacterium]
MILDVLTADNKMLALLALVIALPALFFSLSVHEFAHGFAAYKQGDGYAKAAGRLTLNPFHHIDPLGALMMLLVGFGWAKPVPVVPSNFKNQKSGLIIVSLAGVIANLILAMIAYFLYYFFIFIIVKNVSWFYMNDIGTMMLYLISTILTYLVIVNVNLAVFNLIPIPPLDGYKVFKELTIGRISFRFFSNYERYSTYILLVFLIVGDRIGIISGISSFVFGMMEKVMNLIFTAFI